MTCGPGWSGQRTDRPETRSQVDKLEVMKQGFHVFIAALKLETEYATKSAHLLFCDVVPGMILQPGIVHLRYFWMLIQKRCNGHCVFVLAVYAKLQRFHAADHVVGRFGV